MATSFARMTRPTVAVESADPTLVERLRAEYLEMPGMSLTLDQVVRLCGIERPACQRALDALVHAKFLSLNADGVYARRTEEARHRHTAHAHLDNWAAPRIIRRAS